MSDMLGYYLFLAWKSIRRTPINSLIVVMGIALGVTVATLFSAIYHVYARDPVPKKSGSLYFVRMDSWDPQKANLDGIPLQMTYQDIVGTMKSDIPVRQTASFPGTLRIATKSAPERPIADTARICHADFFAMFDVPFQYGSAWSREADEKAEPIVVIDDSLNQRLFGGTNSVGQVVTIEGREFRVVGVLAPWQPSIRYYDLIHPLTLPVERIYLSMSHVKPMNMWTSGRANDWKPDPVAGYEGILLGERSWIQMWVELSEPAQVANYKRFLDGYAVDQRRRGRFLRPLDNRVTPLLDFMRERNCPPREVTTVMMAANLFLIVCAVSLVGLLWARFLARAAETGVRRALGASRWDIFAVHIVECELFALFGGLLGFVAAYISIRFVNLWHKTMSFTIRDDIFYMDWRVACFAVGISLVAGLVAGVYPAYRACRLAPGIHLRIQ